MTRETIAARILAIQRKTVSKRPLALLEVPAWGLMLFASFVYRLLNHAKWAVYRFVIKPRKARFFTISVGNVKVGGTGKSPLVIKIATRMLNFGNKVAVINRGYLGPTSRLNIISDGVTMRKGPEECADEAYMEALALLGGRGREVSPGAGASKAIRYAGLGDNRVSSLFGARVMTAKMRVDAVDYLESIGFSGVAILDDAFQYYRLSKDLDIVALDYGDPFSNGMTFPAGMLRDRLARLSEAGIAVVTRCPGPPAADDGRLRVIERTLRRNGFSGPIFASGTRLTGIYSENEAASRDFSSLRGRRVLVFSGLGDNVSFFSQVRAAGAENGFDCVCMGFIDHESYGEETVARILSAAAAAGATAFLTTFKDSVKLSRSSFSGAELYTVRFDLWIDREEEFFEAIDGAVAGSAASLGERA